MNRKLMAWILLPAVALILWGCPKKKPATPAPEIAVDTEIVEPTPEPVERPQPPVTEDRQEDILPSDITELNDYLRQRGLIGDVYFELDQSDLRQDARDRLSQNAEWMRANPGYRFSIEGHCDERGTNEYNLALGERRANTARDYLQSLGVTSSMATISYGEERPVCTESTESCWQRNRRAHFVVVGR